MLVNNHDIEAFQRRFATGLSAMLAPDGLGAFILVLANSAQSTTLHTNLTAKLARTFDALRAATDSGDAHGGPDDIAVFEKLCDTGIDAFGVWLQREPGPWRCAYNPLRGLKPERASNDAFTGLQQPFDEQGFHFDKPFLKPEILGEEMFAGRTLRIMYHKFPFAPWHLMLLIDAAEHRPQYLLPGDHKLATALASACHAELPGFGIGFNSIGAGASINHLHLHSFVDEEPLAVELPRWSHNGGEDAYPLRCAAFDNGEESWEAIENMHAEDRPYNLLYRHDKTYLLSRPPQADIKAPAWLSNVTWYEACGGFNLIDKAVFDTLTADDIEDVLASL